MSDDVMDGTLGPLLGVEDWIESLRHRSEPNYHAQSGQYADEASILLKGRGNGGVTLGRGHSRRSIRKSQLLPPAADMCEEHKDTEEHASAQLDNLGCNKLDECISSNEIDFDSPLRPLSEGDGRSPLVADDGHDTASEKAESKSLEMGPIASNASESRAPGYTFGLQGPNSDTTTSNHVATFVEVGDKMNKLYPWDALDRDVLISARNRGLEPTTLGHVLKRRNKLWAQIQCIHKSARADYEKHLRLYQRQFETYSKSGDGWVNVNDDRKSDPIFLRQSTYLTGAHNVKKVMRQVSTDVSMSGADSSEVGNAKPTSRSSSRRKSNVVRGVYDWNNVIFCPNIFDSSDLIHRHARRTVRLYRNLYDCLIHGWVHPGLVVCEVKDATHPIRFATPPEQDCYTVVYAGPSIPENSTQRVVFGEYTGVVYREGSLSDSVFEYAFELNFAPCAWINAEVEISEDAAEIGQNGDQVLLPTSAKFVLDSSHACNELSLVNHYQSVKAYGGEKWVAPNCEWQQIFLDGWPHVVLTSKLGVAVNPGDELVADFGALWFSKVEENAHKFIRNEVIEYRLGKANGTQIHNQLEVPQRPLSSIDVGLVSNSIATSTPVCAICHDSGDENGDRSSSEESDSVSCDGCDRFFHMTCLRNINLVSAVQLVKDGIGHAWLPTTTYKGIPQGSGKFFCNFCRHLAKKIYMHDTGCDYMPLSRGVNVNTHGRFHDTFDLKKYCQRAVPADNSDVNRRDETCETRLPNAHGLMYENNDDAVRTAVCDKSSLGEGDIATSCERPMSDVIIDSTATKDAAVSPSIASSKPQTAEESHIRNVGPKLLMRPLKTPSMHDFAIASQCKLQLQSRNIPAFKDNGSPVTSTEIYTSDMRGTFEERPDPESIRQHRVSGVSEGATTGLKTVDKCTENVLYSPPVNEMIRCPTCFRHFGPSEKMATVVSVEDDTSRPVQPSSASGCGDSDVSRLKANHDSGHGSNSGDASNVLPLAGGTVDTEAVSNTGSHSALDVSETEAAPGAGTLEAELTNNGAPTNASIGSLHQSCYPDAAPFARGLERHSEKADIVKPSTDYPSTLDVDMPVSDSILNQKDTATNTENPECSPQGSSKYEGGGSKTDKTDESVLSPNSSTVNSVAASSGKAAARCGPPPGGSPGHVGTHITTANIDRAVYFYKTLGNQMKLSPIAALSEVDCCVPQFDDTTMADYLGCKYLAGMWQIEPFALFGDTVRVCGDCYGKYGAKANVYVCRLLRRHLSGNFDHPMNTTPTQMRELVLMAYEQHVQMLLRLLVLKNVAIQFMCRLCCHFVSRQLFHQKHDVYPPLPFPSHFMGEESGRPEGLLANPSDLLSGVRTSGGRSLKSHQKKVLQSHLSSFVTSVKNTVCNLPLSSKSDPALNYELLSAMGAFSDEFSRLANCQNIVDYLNDLMSHKVLDADNTPSQLQQMLTKDELRRFIAFRHLAERSPGPFNTSQPSPVRVRKRHRGPTFIPLLGIVPGRSFIYRHFKDGYYRGLVTEYVEDSALGKHSFLVAYSDGDDETLSQKDLITEIMDNLHNIESVLTNLSQNDMRNEEILLRLRSQGDHCLGALCSELRREMLHNLMLHQTTDANKRAEPSKKHSPDGTHIAPETAVVHHDTCMTPNVDTQAV
ncbi:AP2 domain transcription factor AP2VIIa-7 [Babesia ovata]|uniref:AP2 domain transcription factor AP2VIIa-7 n=1 Tax=Babesia ovata TaxID=189622 RepID=A0A2H6KH64_9APIC|nr:AP2 domain transcription factor AP2VIIa-7 [Babesia ovata]GBE62321.1 AP2 domain transcription factor AP2VIIa-7 [Babesia ovata]